MKKQPDTTLIEACRAGDEDAFRAMFTLFAPKMLSICRRYAGNGDEAKDFMQEGFIKVFEKIRTFKGEASLETWISRIMINNAISHLRKKNKNVYVDIEISHEEEISDEDGEAEDIAEIDLDKVFLCLQQLPPGYRAVINLYAIENKSHKEIADMLGITENTSRTQLHKGRLYLKQLLKQQL